MFCLEIITSQEIFNWFSYSVSIYHYSDNEHCLLFLALLSGEIFLLLLLFTVLLSSFCIIGKVFNQVLQSKQIKRERRKHITSVFVVFVKLQVIRSYFFQFSFMSFSTWMKRIYVEPSFYQGYSLFVSLLSLIRLLCSRNVISILLDLKTLIKKISFCWKSLWNRNSTTIFHFHSLIHRIKNQPTVLTEQYNHK